MTGEQRREAHRQRIIGMLIEVERADQQLSTNEELALLMPLADRARRFLHAIKAFPGMKWLEFVSTDDGRTAGPPRRGRKKKTRDARINGTAIARAAQDYDRIAAFWSRTPEGMAGVKPPIPHLELAAELHGADEDALGSRVNRPRSRNAHRQPS